MIRIFYKNSNKKMPLNDTATSGFYSASQDHFMKNVAFSLQIAALS